MSLHWSGTPRPNPRNREPNQPIAAAKSGQYGGCNFRSCDPAMAASTLSRWLRAMRWATSGTPVQRRRVRLEMARMSAGLFGDFPLSEDYKVWRDDAAFMRDYHRLSPGNPYSQDRKWTVREYVRLSNALKGDLAECGCYQGATSFFMRQASTAGELFLFDSFEGLSTPDARDQIETDDVMSWSAGDLNTTQDILRRNLQGLDGVHILQGWIPDRFAEVATRSFRLVHIDVDLYQPTRDSLEFFYPRLVKGGFIVMDDYGFKTCPGAKQAADEFAATVGIGVLHLPTGQGVLSRP